MYYVYRFIDKNENIIYIGKSNRIDLRIKEHFSNYGHLPKECYENTIRVECIEFSTKVEMDIKEIYYINKFKPEYNKNYKDGEESPNLAALENNDVWSIYQDGPKIKISDFECECGNQSFKIVIEENLLDQLSGTTRFKCKSCEKEYGLSDVNVVIRYIKEEFKDCGKTK